MKERTKKTLKWVFIAAGSLIFLIISTIIIAFFLIHNSIYEPVSFVERESSYVMPDFPESDVIPIEDESFLPDDESEDEISFDESIPDTSGSSDKSGTPGGSGGSGGTYVPKETPIYIVEPIDENILNILLVGRDVFDSLGGRSDSMMLLSYNKKTGEIILTSFLRDSLVPIEGHGWNRLNTTYRFGNVGLTINTINEIFQLDIQHYVSVDYSGFIELINRIGGVSVYISQEEANYLNEKYNWDISKGEHHLNGSRALIFSRIRKLSGGDFNRTERQRRLLSAVIKKITETYSAGETVPILYDALKQVKTNLPRSSIISLIYGFMAKDTLSIGTGAVPASGTYSLVRYNGMSVIRLDFQKNIDIIHERIYGKE